MGGGIPSPREPHVVWSSLGSLHLGALARVDVDGRAECARERGGASAAVVLKRRRREDRHDEVERAVAAVERRILEEERRELGDAAAEALLALAREALIMERRMPVVYIYMCVYRGNGVCGIWGEMGESVRTRVRTR